MPVTIACDKYENAFGQCVWQNEEMKERIIPEVE